MKSSNPKSKNRNHNLVFFLLVLLFYSFFVFTNREKLFQRFDPEVVNRYLKSQDILDTEDKIKDRIFVSDEEIYIASGFLYANGSRPTDYNFQHPPFIKYLFGLSAKYFNLPLLPNIIFGAILLFEIYILGDLVFKKKLIGLLASMLLLIDPVFKEVTVYALLDLGQMVFILGFITSTFYFKRHWIIQGVLLGLAMASKFYSPLIIFLGIIYMYKFFTKQFILKNELLVLVIASLVFSFTYLINFPFNIFFYQAKIIKFMLDHNQAVEWGGVLPMFFGGYFMWPVLFFANLFAILKAKVQDLRFLLYLIPILYVLVLTFQLPFTRYFILILPFLYLSLSKLICEKLLPH
jgi:hypothetical protein